MEHKKRIVIVGATSAIAEHCARLWCQKAAVDLTLVARDGSRVERVASDLKIRSPDSTVRTVVANFLDVTSIKKTVDEIFSGGPVDIVLIAHGSLPSQENCQEDLHACSHSLEVNGISPVLYAEAVASHLAHARRGTLALIGSVAGDRGRKSNYVYGAAKGLVDRYAQGLQHRFAGTDVTVILIKPGPTDTPMTAHLKGRGAKLAALEDVALSIVKAQEKGQTTVYVPAKWRLIMLVIKHMPSAIFNKLNI